MPREFISVGALGEGFAPESLVLPATDELNGRTFATDIDDVGTLAVSGESASWAGGQMPARVTSIRPGLYLIDGVRDGVSTTFVVDTEASLITVVEGTLPDEDTRRSSAWTRVQQGLEPTGVQARFSHGHLDGSAGPVHGPTTVLVGLRNHYRYSATEAYEHVYLTPDLYAWHCLAGVEEDLADVDACHHIKIREGLVLFVWREKIVPTLGVVLIDLDQLRTDGKIFGNDGFDVAKTVNFPVGAAARVLNRTEY